jgi:hypothetical protein
MVGESLVVAPPGFGGRHRGTALTKNRCFGDYWTEVLGIESFSVGNDSFRVVTTASVW